MQLVGPARIRIAIVWFSVLALVLAVVATPVRATDGHDDDHDDLEWARHYALEVIDHKIALLKEHRESAQTDRVWTIYTEGIEEIGAIKERILDEDDAEDIWELKHKAIAVYAETKERARAADDEADDAHKKRDEDEQKRKDDEARKKREQDEKKRKNDQAKKKREQDEKKRKNDEAKKKREQEDKKRKEQEEAAAALEAAKADTRALIDKKWGLMKAASLASHHDQMSKIYLDAANQLSELRQSVDTATSLEKLDGIRDQVWEIVHAAKKLIAAYRPGHDKKDDNGTSDENGEGGESGDTGSDDTGSDDTGSDDTGSDDTGDGAVEEATILATLNGMELQVDMYQIEIFLAMNPETGGGFPEGPAAIDAGVALLESIDAARQLTGDELVLAFLEVNDEYNAYLHLVLVFDLTYGAGIFNGEVSPI